MKEFGKYVTLLDTDVCFWTLSYLYGDEVKGLIEDLGMEKEDLLHEPGGVIKQGKTGTVVTCPNYPARDLGITHGMGLSKARKLAEKQNKRLLVVPEELELYDKWLRKIFSIIYEQVPFVWGFPGLDTYQREEWYMLWDGAVSSYDQQHERSESLRKLIKEETGVTCTTGNAKNKTLAKLAADLAKPDGNKTITEEDLNEIYSLPVDMLSGIGDDYGGYLESIGIRTIGDLADPAHVERVQLPSKIHNLRQDVLPGYVTQLVFDFMYDEELKLVLNKD